MDFTVNVLQLNGSYSDIGLKQGQNLKIEASFERESHMNRHVDPERASQLLTEISPGIVDEIKGLAHGVGIDLNTAIKVYSGYDVAFPNMGCTALAEDSYYVRNYDFSPDFYDARLVCSNPEHGYASVGFSQQIVGRLDGMNEKGLVIGLHLVNEQNGEEGFLGTTIVRMVLDQCRNVEEAIELIRRIPHGYSMNYSIMDGNGRKAVVEGSPAKQVVRWISPLFCANHFEADELMNLNRSEIGGSLERVRYLKDLLLDKELSPLEAYHHFNNTHSPLFFTNYQEYFGTMHTVVYSPEDLNVIVGVGGDCEPFVFSFRDWLRGEITLPKEVKGNIVTLKIKKFK